MDTEKKEDEKTDRPEVDVRDLTPEKDAKGGGSRTGGLGNDSQQPIPREPT